jgi:peptide/nickel transport system permease protein/oligopeptide transport system permease protein
MMPTYCRLMCAQVTSLKESDYVTAARSIGSNNLRIMLRHLLPNAFPPLLVLVTINLGTAIMMEASLSFLGIGIVPPTPTWGGMVASGQRFIFDNPLLSFMPGAAILLVVLAFNMVGDGLRDALDPRLRGTESERDLKIKSPRSKPQLKVKNCSFYYKQQLITKS